MARLPNSASAGRTSLLCLGCVACLVSASPARGVIIIGSSTGNTSAPADAGLAERWNQVGNFGSYLGTPIAPQYFLTAKHLGILPGQAITFLDSTTYTTTARFLDPASDLAIYQIDGTFPNDKIVPMYSGSFSTNQAMTIFGRGRPRTNTEVFGQKQGAGDEAKGWTWGTGTGARSWGTNTYDGLTTLAGAGPQLTYDFDVGGGNDEGVLSTGDSGGPVFMQENGLWKLAGINYAVGPKDVREIQAGPTLEAAVYDYGGLYLNIAGTWTLQSTAGGDKPAVSYSSSIPANSTWIESVIVVPEPATLGIVGFAGLALITFIRRQTA